MGTLFTELEHEQIEFIQNQKIFFVATAAEKGSVNLSPKGMDTLCVINKNKVAWLNLTGSSNETSAHIQKNHRMTLMFCAFEGPPKILRLYGQASMLHRADENWEKHIALFPKTPGSRQIFILTLESVQSSCGTAVPLYEYRGDRRAFLLSAQKKEEKGIARYWEKKNQTSLDGFPTNILKLSGMQKP